MPSILGQMFFRADNGARDVGWSEDHYIIGAGDLSAALPLLRTLADARAALLGAGAVINYLRVSDVATFRDSQVETGIRPGGILVGQPGNFQLIPLAPDNGNPDSPINPSGINGIAINEPKLLKGVNSIDIPGVLVDQPQVGFLVRLELGSPFTARRALVLRGMPDDVILTNTGGPASVNNTLSANWLKLYREWVLTLTNGRYGMRAQDATAATAAVASWTVDPTTHLVTCHTAVNFAAVPGDGVRISGVVIPNNTGGIKRLNAYVTVLTSPDAKTFTFSSTNPRSPFTTSTILQTVLVAGNLTRQVKAYQAYTKIVGRRWGERKCGLPFDPVRGRRKARA